MNGLPDDLPGEDPPPLLPARPPDVNPPRDELLTCPKLLPPELPPPKLLPPPPKPPPLPPLPIISSRRAVRRLIADSVTVFTYIIFGKLEIINNLATTS